jgi:hypothetical protein
MAFAKVLLLLLLLTILLSAKSAAVKAFPASSFTIKDGDWYDNWNIDRNYAEGPNGFIPNLANETLNENKELAYHVGQTFLANYASKIDRAVAILKFVQTWTEYGYDSDNVVKNGVPQEEWAWNADEMAHAFNETTGVKAIGDCEDMAFLCGTIYIGAEFDAAIVDAPEHCALLIWLPEFSNGNMYWNLPNDNRDAGWIWVEATGSSNPLGWTPPDFQDGGWIAYPIGDFQFSAGPQPPPDEWAVPFFGIINSDELILIFIALFVIISIARAGRHSIRRF